MNKDEFNNFISSFVNDEYSNSENDLIFNQSIVLQKNEIFSDKHLRMYFPEFLEGMCRVIDKLSPPPLNENIGDWIKRFQQPLINKLENIIHVIFRNINHPDFKNIKTKFPSLKKDQYTDLYIIDYENNLFYEGYKMIKNSSWSLL